MKYQNVVFAAAMAFSCTAAFFSANAYSADEAVQSISGGETPAQAASPQAQTDKGTVETNAPVSTEAPTDPADEARKEYALGMMMINHNRYDAAAKHLENARRFDPKNYNTLVMLGKVYTRVNRHTDSVKALNDATRLEPSKPEAYDLLMQLYLYLKRPGKSLETANAAMKAGVADTALPDLGWTYYQLGKLDEAESCYKKSIEAFGESFGTLRNMGILYFARGDYQKSIEYYDKAQKLDDSTTTLPYLKALAYVKLDKKGETFNETEKFKSREKNPIKNIPKYQKLYFPHTEVPNINSYVFLLKDMGKPEDTGVEDAPAPEGGTAVSPEGK